MNILIDKTLRQIAADHSRGKNSGKVVTLTIHEAITRPRGRSRCHALRRRLYHLCQSEKQEELYVRA